MVLHKYKIDVIFNLVLTVIPTQTIFTNYKTVIYKY